MIDFSSAPTFNLSNLFTAHAIELKSLKFQIWRHHQRNPLYRWITKYV